MSRTPDLQTMLAIGHALDALDRRSNRPPGPAIWPNEVMPRAPISSAAIARSLRAIDRDIGIILSRPGDLAGRELTLAALGCQLVAISTQIEGGP